MYISYTPCANTLCVGKFVDLHISAKIVKAARAMLDWKSADLSEKSGVPHDTIRAFESGRTKRLATLNEKAVSDAITKAGLDLIPENGGGAGLRFRDRDDA